MVDTELKSLALVLSSKLKKKDPRTLGTFGGIISGSVMVIRYTLKSLAHVNEIVAGIIFLIAEGILLYLLYKALYKNHSSIFAQGVVASVLCVIQFIILGFELTSAYGTVEMGEMIASLLFMGALAWLGILIIVAIIKKFIK